MVAVGNPFENLDPAAALLEKTGHDAEAIEFLEQLVKSAPWEPAYRLRLTKAELATGTSTSSTAAPAPTKAELATIASSPSVAYDVRLKAAESLAGRSHGDLGGGELNLMAEAPPAITPEAADKFYFYEARIRAAAHATNPQVKVQLLSHCIIDFPQREEARVPLFQAAFAARTDEYAIGVIEKFSQTRFLSAYVPEGWANQSREEELIASAGEEEDTGDESNAAATTVDKLSREQQAQLRQMIGDTMTRLDRLDEAVSYYTSARRLEAASATRTALARKIVGLKAELQIERQNAARQPLLHEALEQDRVVRPQLIARAAPVPKPASSKGGAKP